ncbi:MAG: hypothetical protein ACXABF_17065 [Candidatus Thorarchaeota archaeon]|jgi:tetrahydromethanopterin S-methyltransferase subunit H
MMLEYKAKQKTLKIGGVRIGGLPGRIPTVLIPSIFYAKDRLVKNTEKGEIDKSAAENLLSMLTNITEKTGLGTMLDVVATTSEAMERHLQFLVDRTDFPLLRSQHGWNQIRKRSRVSRQGHHQFTNT